MTASEPISAATAPSEAAPHAHADRSLVRIKAWKHLHWLRAGFSTRQGGQTDVYSDGQAHEQNLGWTPEDSPAIVAENRRQFVRQFQGFAIDDLVTIRQIHGGVVQLVERGAPLCTVDGKAILSGDGLLTKQRGLLLGIQTADCVPILLADTRTRAVAAFHAGWRGTVARIVERGVAAMRTEFNSHPADLVASIGPAIGPCCFAVGADVQSQFFGAFSYASDLFSQLPDSQLHLNLWDANRRQLLDAGLREDAVTVIGECTACTRALDGQRKYFSHRAERGYTGRMLSVIGVPAS